MSPAANTSMGASSEPGTRINVAPTAVATAKAPLETGTVCRLLLGMTEIEARLRLLDREMLEPRESILEQSMVADDVAQSACDHFTIQPDSPLVIAAGGKVFASRQRRRKRHEPRAMFELAVISAGRLEEMMTAKFANAGSAGVRLVDLTRLVSVVSEPAHRSMHDVDAPEVGGPLLEAPAFPALRENLLGALTRYHQEHPTEYGMPLNRLVCRLGIAEPIVVEGLRELVATREVTRSGALYRRADFSPTRNVTEQVRTLEATYRKGDLMPPDELKEVGHDIRRREALNHLIAAGTLIRALNRVEQRTILFHRASIEAAKERLATHFPDANRAETGFLVREAGAVLSISRKYSIPLLEHLDAVCFTQRIGERRVFVKGAL